MWQSGLPEPWRFQPDPYGTCHLLLQQEIVLEKLAIQFTVIYLRHRVVTQCLVVCFNKTPSLDVRGLILGMAHGVHRRRRT